MTAALSFRVGEGQPLLTQHLAQLVVHVQPRGRQHHAGHVAPRLALDRHQDRVGGVLGGDAVALAEDRGVGGRGVAGHDLVGDTEARQRRGDERRGIHLFHRTSLHASGSPSAWRDHDEMRSQGVGYQGFRQHVLSLVTALEEKDYAIALRHAESAAALCAVSDRFPGAAQSRAALESQVAACRLLSGQGDEATIATLEQASRSLPGVGPAFPAWALARHYHSKGMTEAAARHLGVVRSLVPHCVPLNTLA